MLTLPVEVTAFPLQFFVKPSLVEFSRTLTVLSLSLTKHLIFTLLFRCFTICSDMQSFHLEVEQLRQILKCNNYPVGLIDQCVKTFFNKIYVSKRILITVPKKVVLIVLPFLGQFSLNLRSRLYNCFNKTLPHCNTNVIFQSKNSLSNLFRFKDNIPKELRSHIVCKFLCSNCNIAYYGETERHLNVRSGEHLNLSALTGNRVNNNKISAVKDHCLFFNHVASFEDFSILTYESNPSKLLVKEVLLASRDKSLLNKQVKSIPLQLF